jgi:hypothetical protein
MSPWPGFKGDGADPDPSLLSDELAGDSESGYEVIFHCLSSRCSTLGGQISSLIPIPFLSKIDAHYDAFLDLPREIHDPCFTGTFHRDGTQHAS